MSSSQPRAHSATPDSTSTAEKDLDIISGQHLKPSEGEGRSLSMYEVIAGREGNKSLARDIVSSTTGSTRASGSSKSEWGWYDDHYVPYAPQATAGGNDPAITNKMTEDLLRLKKAAYDVRGFPRDLDITRSFVFTQMRQLIGTASVGDPDPFALDAVSSSSPTSSRDYGPEATSGDREHGHPWTSIHQKPIFHGNDDVIGEMVNLLGNPDRSDKACQLLMDLADLSVVERSSSLPFPDAIISKITALLSHPSRQVCASAMQVLRSLVPHEASRKSLSNETLHRCLLLAFDTTSIRVRYGVMSLLRMLAEFDDINTSFSSVDIVARFHTCLENLARDTGTFDMVVSILGVLSYHDATRAIYEDLIHAAAVLLGSTDTTVHTNTARLFSNLATSFPGDTIMQIVAHLNSPSEDISYTAADVLSKYTWNMSYRTGYRIQAVLNPLSQPDVILQLVSFMRSGLVHVQCCVMAIFALMVHKEPVRTVILDTKLPPIVSDLLNTDNITTKILEKLLWSLGQFMQHDDLRSSILQTDAIYGLACLRSSARLPEDSKALLSSLISDEKLFLSFYSDLDDSSPLTYFQCLIGAQEAMERVLSEENALKELLMSYHITLQGYFVQAGFDEDLLNSGGGHLEVIYIHLIKEVEAQASGMLDALAQRFHPFPCVLLTPKNSYRTPTSPELPLGFDSIILDRGNRHYQLMKELKNHSEGRGKKYSRLEERAVFSSYNISNRHNPERRHMCPQCGKRFDHPSSLETHLYVLHAGDGPYSCPALGCNKIFGIMSKLMRHYYEYHGDESSEPMVDAESTQKGGGNGNRQDGDDASKKTPPNKKSEESNDGSEGGGAGKAPDDGDDDQPSDRVSQLNGVEARRERLTPAIIFDSHLKLDFSRPSNPSGQGSSLNRDTHLQTFHTRADVAVNVQSSPGPCPKVSLRFNDFGFYTEPVALDYPYKNTKAQVKVESLDKDAYVQDFLPRSTPAAGPTVRQTDGRELTTGVDLTVGTKAGVSGTVNLNGKTTRSEEVTRNVSRITATLGISSVKWSYHVGDIYHQESGLGVHGDRLPFLEFAFEEAPPEKPLRLQLSGYWVTTFTPQKGLFAILKSKRPGVPLLRNFCHLTCITLPHQLPKSGRMKLQLEARMPCSMTESVALKSEKLGVEMEGKFTDQDS